ncbi:MAG: DUF4912 domain-containing protein [Candidatus Eremiobacteraeota bacterium]|nr:DUF4912 domain-containing protein [Candidatus Eremiobacteraeota bacterium]
MHTYEERFTEGKGLTVPPPSELPESYDEDILVLLVRDPYWAFGYWDISKSTMDRLRKKLGEESLDKSKLLIRIYTGEDKNKLEMFPELHMEVDVTGPARSWYFHLGLPKHYFYGLLGYLTPDGNFIEISRSNVIESPSDTISDRVDEAWLAMEETYRRILRLSREGESSPQDWAELRRMARRHILEIEGSPHPKP